ncbi:MAG: chloride channel protein [Verrucomicrobiales bacterium]
MFEELLDNFSMRALGGMVVAVVIAAAVSRSILGEDPVLPAHLAAHYDTSLWMLVALPMGLAAGLLGHGFVRLVLGVRAGFRKSPLPPWSRPALGGALCGGIALGAFFLTGRYGDAQNSVWSIGYESLERAFEGHIAVQIIAILFFFKLAAVVAAYGSGGSGGLFSPTLFLGGMLGALVGAGAVALDGWVPIPGFPSGEKILGACVLLGMGAMFAAVIRCPFTSLIIIFEMTGSYSLILPLMAGNMIAWRIARRFGPVPIYNALLLQDGVTLRHMPAYRGPQDYQNLPVSAIMTHEVTAVRGSHSCGEALRRLRESGARFRTFPVLGEDDAVSGILAFSEIANADPEATAASLIDDNAHPVVALQPDTSIRDAANKMLHADVRQAPILSAVAPHRLLGYVTLNDIARQQNASAL